MLASRIGERLAFYLLLLEEPKADAEAVEMARATVEATPAEPPTWQYARALATYANALLSEGDYAHGPGLGPARPTPRPAAAARPGSRRTRWLDSGVAANRDGQQRRGDRG